MKRWVLRGGLCAALGLISLLAAAQVPAPSAAKDSRRSGFDDMGASTQALQKDDSQNPAWLWVSDGQRRFNTDCARCHADDSARSLRGAAARYPAYDALLNKPLTLDQRINQCRVRHVKAAPLAAESDELLALSAYVALQSRGLPLQADADPRSQPHRERGAQLYSRRMGQLDFSCAQCHDQNAGGRLAGALIPQAHPTAYPIYRLEWQGMGSLQRRLRNCMTGVRAEPFAYDSDEFVQLELYLKQRAAGMKSEAPGVRP